MVHVDCVCQDSLKIIMESPELTVVGDKRKLEDDRKDEHADKRLKEENNDDIKSESKPEDIEVKEEVGPVPGDATEIDELSYTKGEEFTSEIYKVQIHNLPKLYGHNQLKKRLKSSLNLNPNKTSVELNRNCVAYVCFRNETEQLEGISKIHGHIWKGKTLEAKAAAPNADPFLKKKREERDADESKSTDKVEEAVPLTKEEAEASLKERVLPLWNVDYQEQLVTKTQSVKEALRKVAKHKLTKHLYISGKLKTLSDGTVCPLEPIVPSPITSEYRNKNEFTIGYTIDGKEVCVGFRYGLYKDGTTSVGDPSNMKIAMPQAVPVVKSFTQFLQSSHLTPFLQQDNSGHWHTLTVRTYRSGDVLAMVDFVTRKLTEEDINEVKTSIKKFYTEGEGKDINLTSFHFRTMATNGFSGEKKAELLFGNQDVYEHLMNLKFRVSPEAFFQINSLATEKLYELIGIWSGVSINTVLLDVCCGTGTIGLSLAKKVKTVIGIEMCKEAIEDAKVNASINGISNAQFHCAKVEHVIASVVADIPKKDDIVAIVDPPRPGLHKSVIKTLRKAREINRLVYVSCNPLAAVENFADLIRPETGKHQGDPFTIVKAVPVDLFPGTRHCELVVLFQRGADLPPPVNTETVKADKQWKRWSEMQQKTTQEVEDDRKLKADLEIKKRETGENYTIFANMIMLRSDIGQFKKDQEAKRLAEKQEREDKGQELNTEAVKVDEEHTENMETAKEEGTE